MAVLIEAINVIVRRHTLEARYPGGVHAYAADCPNATFCADESITRVGFMSPPDVAAFVERLEEVGFSTLDDRGQFADIAIVDERTGPTAECDWLSLGVLLDPEFRFCQLRGEDMEDVEVVFPASWEPHGPLDFAPNAEAELRLTLETASEGASLYSDRLSGKWIGIAFPWAQPSVDIDQAERGPDEDA